MTSGGPSSPAGEMKPTSLLIHKAGREQYLTIVLCLLATSFLTQEQPAGTGLHSPPCTHDELGEGL